MTIAKAKGPPAPRVLQSAGAVVLRGPVDAREVLLVHRPAYDDWTLPKGKPDYGEYLTRTAVREVFEETGATIRLGVPLGKATYPVSKGTKESHWWVGHLVSQIDRRPDKEVDKSPWLPVEDALQLLTWDDERDMLTLALDQPPTSTIIIVRHGKAVDRKHWASDDRLRPLNGRGRRQSLRLVQLLWAYGVEETVSSTSTRCLTTFTPYTRARGVVCQPVQALAEEDAADNPAAVTRYMHALRNHCQENPGTTIAICGHRPVLPRMFAALDVIDRPLTTGSVVVIHLGRDGDVVALEEHPAPF
ncbi:MAG TPA: NUDIX hydrolase [Propionibacteriaceae bacterium]|nr:NUDIX hydrolase [Propionibacteriaceae bacterium]